MVNNLAPRIPRRRAYWAAGQPVGSPVLNFRQLQYLPLPKADPDLAKALQGAWVDCGLDLHKQLIEFGGVAKVWMTVLVEYEPVNPMANKQPVEQYLSATLTRIFKIYGTLTPSKIPYIDSLRILTDRIREFNAKYIRDKSGLRLARVLKLTLKLVKYAPVEGRGWQPLPEFLSMKTAIINIQNNDERCFGYAVLYFLEREQLPEKFCYRAYLYKEEMFERFHLDTLPYSISPNDAHLYQDQHQMNINVFSFFDDEGRARHPLVISRKNYERVANLLYWKGHYAPIKSIPRLFSDITKHVNQKYFACAALDITHRRKFSRVTRSSAPETTSCRCSMCFLRQAPNSRN